MKHKENKNKYLDEAAKAVQRCEAKTTKKRTRQPSEQTRLKKCLGAMHEAGLAPQSIYFHHNGGFEVKFTVGQSGEAVDFEVWLAAQMEGKQ